MFAYIKNGLVDIVSSEKIQDISEEYIEKEYEGILQPFFDGENIIEKISKFEEIQRLLITSEDPTKVDTHGVKGFDIDSCILQRFFGGDRGKEIGFTQRMIYLQMKMRTPEEDEEMRIIFAGYEKKEEYKNFLKSLNS